MAKRYVPKTYNNYRVARLLLKTVLFVLLVGIVLFVSLFFGLQKYKVATEDGIKLVIPFLQEDTASPES